MTLQRNFAFSSWPILLLLSLVFNGVFYRDQLIPKRDLPLERQESYHDHQVVATLWEDPLHAARRHYQSTHPRPNGHDEPTIQRKSKANSPEAPREPSNTAKSEHSLKKIEDCFDPEYSVHFLMVMVNSNDDRLAHESRIKTRYSIHAALRALAYAPDHRNEIHFFFSSESRQRANAKKTSRQVFGPAYLLSAISPNGHDDSEKQGTSKEVGSRQDALDMEQSLGSFTVYESFSRERKSFIDGTMAENTNDEDGLESKQVVVLWLPDTYYHEHPLNRLDHLVSSLNGMYKKWKENQSGSTDSKQPEFSLIGPNTSDTLVAMLDELRQTLAQSEINDNTADAANGGANQREPTWEDLRRVHVFSATATAPRSRLVYDADSRRAYEGLNATFASFKRTIGTDDLLCHEFALELRRRRIDPRKNAYDHVLLVADWNSYFTRTLPRTFLESLSDDTPDHGRSSADRLSNIHVVKFSEGIDGRIVDKSKQGDSSVEPRKESSKVNMRPNAVGEQRIDYLNRAARMIRDGHKRNGHRIRAIGVFARDVYDKLLIISALRHYFPNALYFTNDLDARLVDSSHADNSRNLLVASHFGLRLADPYQSGFDGRETMEMIPPFRDCYQTSRYFACRLALKDDFQWDGSSRDDSGDPYGISDQRIQESVCSPRLFEIGADTIIDLSVDNLSHSIHPQKRLTPIQHSEFTLRTSVIKKLAWSVLATFLAVVLAASTSKTIADRFWGIASKLPHEYGLTSADARAESGESHREKPGEKAARRTMNVVVWAIIGVGFILMIMIAYDHFLNPVGEFWSVQTGTSIWVTVCLEFFAVSVVAYWLVRGLISIHKDISNFEEKGKRFGLQADDDAPPSRQDVDSTKERSTLTRLLDYIWLNCTFVGVRLVYPSVPTEPKVGGYGANDVRKLWEAYREQRRLRFVACRVGFHTLLFVAIFFVLLGFRPQLSGAYRGTLSLICSFVFDYAALLALIVATFFVVDASLTAGRFIRLLAKYPSKWPDSTIERWTDVRHGDEAILREWLDTQLIAKHSETIGRLIYLPFTVLFLLVIARLPYFDNIPWPFALMVFLLLLFCYMTGCALYMRSAAEKGRRRIIERLQDYLTTADADDLRIAQLTLDEIRNESRGAFSPISENPVVRALLIPSGGASILALIEFISSG